LGFLLILFPRSEEPISKGGFLISFLPNSLPSFSEKPLMLQGNSRKGRNWGAHIHLRPPFKVPWGRVHLFPVPSLKRFFILKESLKWGFRKGFFNIKEGFPTQKGYLEIGSGIFGNPTIPKRLPLIWRLGEGVNSLG